MASFSGSFEVVPPSDLPPEDVPKLCALCANADPVCWYVVEPVTHEGSEVGDRTVLARWWAVCANCDDLIASGAGKEVRKRQGEASGATALEVVDEFLRQGERWGGVTA